VDDLRDRLNDLDKNETYAVYCREGYRSYLAYRILKQMGFRVKNYVGGYLTYTAKKSADKKEH
jgi:rhodanese-related sulfurtransferase